MGAPDVFFCFYCGEGCRQCDDPEEHQAERGKSSHDPPFF
jgi:hypothetical protein